MRRFPFVFLCTAIFLASVHDVPAQSWQPVAPGIDYRYYRFESPQNDVFVTRMDRATTSVIVDGSLANGKIAQNGSWNAETIPSQVSRYDGAFGFWGRQTARYRYKVVAAINGSGFSTTNGCPDSAMVMGGAFIKRTFYSTGAENGYSMGFAYKLGSTAPTPGTPYMSDTFGLPADPSKNRLSFTDGTWLQYHKINDKAQTDSIILYTHHYGLQTPATTGVTEIVVKMENAQPLRIIPWSNFTRGTVTEIKKSSSGQTIIPFDCIVVVASGNKISGLEGKVPAVGTEVRFSAETSDSTGLDWTNMYCAIGPMWGVILRNGAKPTTSSDSYHVAVAPRTAVAYNSQYIYFIVVDGRSTRSSGMTLSALADFCINELAATDAVNNDGGGSSCLWVDGQIKNVPSDGSPRAVANGLMMIQLLPKETSTQFTAAQTVYTNTPGTTLNLRTGPGAQFHVIQALPNESPLTILEDSLKGLRAQDIGSQPSYWWKVRTAGGVEGWVTGSYLSGQLGIDQWNSY
jgi:hypothetical protein